MVKYYIILLLIAVSSCFIFKAADRNVYVKNDLINNWENSCYFNTRFLSQPEQVKKQMICDGFTEYYITTEDGITLNALYLSHPQAQYTLIVCSGWPGNKEHMSSLFALFADQPCNMLFIDARSSHKIRWLAQGLLWSYGMNEYKDIIAALHFATAQSNAPLFILSTCAGSFNTLHALYKLNNRIHPFNIKGVILDSSWSTVSTTARSFIQGRMNEKWHKLCAMLYQKENKETIKKTYLYQTLSITTTITSQLFYHVFFKQFHNYYDQQTNLSHKIEQIAVPLFFIHSYDDAITSIYDAQQLAHKAHNKECWWITQPSRHSLHHIKHKHAYKNNVIAFFEKQLATHR